MLECIRNSAILWISHHSLEYSAKFREILIKIGAKFDEKRYKNSDFSEFWTKIRRSVTKICLIFEIGAVHKDCKSCSSRKMLKNAYLDAKIGFDAEENEPKKE